MINYIGPDHERRAVFVFAGQSNTHTVVNRAAAEVRQGALPSWMNSPADLDFLDPLNPLFRVDRALFSMGQFLHGSVPVGQFSPRAGVTILGDSGGYQLISNPDLWRGDDTRRWVLTALEHNTNEAMTLDIPTRGIRPHTPWSTFADALAVTEDSLRFFDRHRAGQTRFLNVLQGRDRREAKTWLSRVEWFPAGGWALGGDMRRDLAHVTTMLCDLADRQLLAGQRNRIHFLGMADLPGAVLLTALQRGLRARTGDDALLITFDVSSPSLIASKSKAFGYPRFNGSTFSLEQWRAPATININDPGEGADVHWPIATTAIGRRMRRGDICVCKPGSTSSSAWDALSLAMVVNHNVEAMLSAIRSANDIMELPVGDAVELAPGELVSAYNAIMVACEKHDPEAYLRPFKLLKSVAVQEEADAASTG